MNRNTYGLTAFEKTLFWIKILYDYVNQIVSKFAVTSFNTVYYFCNRQNLRQWKFWKI